jgi:sugar lactone lactonase YvrE
MTTLAGGGVMNQFYCQPYGADSAFTPLNLALDAFRDAYVTGLNLDEIAPDGGLTLLVPGSASFFPIAVTVSPGGALFTSSGSSIYRVVDSSAVFFAGGDSDCGDGGIGGACGLVADSSGNLYVADCARVEGCSRIDKITPDGTISVFAGKGGESFLDGPAAEALFFAPNGLALDDAGYLYVTDQGNARIRKVAPDGTTSTLAGDGDLGFTDGTGGPLGTTTFGNPTAVAVDGLGYVYVADSANNAIRKVAPDGTTITLAGNGDAGYIDGTLGRNGTTEFNNPTGVALDGLGNVYVADTGNCYIRVIHPQ